MIEKIKDGDKDDQSLASLDSSTLPSHYIGIGASAGGLEALQTLLTNLPIDTGACFIIVQHLSPDFKSMMLELLSKHTAMQIINVVGGIAVKPDTIYLIPPKKNMIVKQGHLLLLDKVPDSGLNLPIDIFFRSLAEDQQHKAIGIILSGTGSDGSRGIKALKEAGALAIAQEPESAKFDGMPNSAISTGIIDLVLRPEDMGKKLESYIRHPLVSGDTAALRQSLDGDEDTLSEIFSILKIKSEIDFAKYKPSTVARRIERRMTIKQVDSVQEYLTILFREPYEVQVLSKELLIGVTRFFRDEEAFDELRQKVIPDLVRTCPEDKPIRIWTVACSSGEEAYSLAMLFDEEMERQKVKRNVKVFATDVNSEAITDASNGIYGPDIIHDVGTHYISAYFTKTVGGGYQISKDIRQMVVFAVHNIIVDPPFSNMDLVSCRNVLIYFQHSIQKRTLTSLHFSLRKYGYLFLGSSESLGDLAPHFEVINERAKIYRKRSNVRIPIGSSPSLSNTHTGASQSIPPVDLLVRNYRGTNVVGSTISFANESLITQYAPPCLLLNEEYEALHVYGDVSPFIRRLPPGKISHNVKDLVNEDISIAVTSAISRAKSSREEVFYTDVFTFFSEKSIRMNLRVKYIKEHDVDSSPGYYWVVFEKNDDSESAIPANHVSYDASEQSRQRIADLEQEVKRCKENLQVTVEELETTNEELHSSNEELMSANEELQSTNEELQSVNEELYTVNSEFQEKIAEISQANSDLDEVLELSKIGIIFLDENMLIRRYTKAASNYVNLMDGDIDRPLHHISTKIQYDNLFSDVSEAFSSWQPKEIDLTLEKKRIVKVAILPYSYSDVAQTQGVAITFTDISNLKYTELGMEVAYKELRSSINNALDLLDTTPFDKTINILIINNQDSELETLSQNLLNISDFKIKAEKENNIDSAYRKMLKSNFDVCLIDYELTGDTALDFIDRFANDDVEFPIVVTGNKIEQHRALLLSHGVLDLIDKEDISPTLLSRNIRYAIRRKQIDNEINTLLLEKPLGLE